MTKSTCAIWLKFFDNCMQEQRMRLKHHKCTLLKNSVDCFGHHLNAQGFQTSTKKVEAILKAPATTSVTELWSFLGLLNYDRKFIL